LAIIRVTDETAATGKHSLEIIEKPGLEHAWEPYITYPLTLEEGELKVGFDLRWDEGGPFTFEWRDDPYVYSMGPQLVLGADGWLAANGKRLLELPTGEWIRFDIACVLGDESTGTYDLTVRVAGEDPQTFEDLAHHADFSAMACAVLMSGATEAAHYYLDNLQFRPSDE